MVRKKIKLEDPWPGGVSDGLYLDCPYCLRIPSFDYRVSDELWVGVVPEKFRLGVLCLPCLDAIANRKGWDVSEHLESIQFCGQGKTIVLEPKIVYEWEAE